MRIVPPSTATRPFTLARVPAATLDGFVDQLLIAGCAVYLGDIDEAVMDRDIFDCRALVIPHPPADCRYEMSGPKIYRMSYC